METDVVRVAAGSQEYVRLPYTSTVVDAAVDVGLVKWPVHAEPTTYVTATVAAGEARFMVGTTVATTLLPKSLYRIWARVADTPERPLEPVGWIMTY